ncbi:uncharacterized protein G2W53_012303 [Senna tora]|uniref:Uncharacterized protein n=1 Tax=Senna tora TaxID=362788 RepID=A0A834WNG0_9FABA|nr:uncharacterized protein G2W53_012303 [Senna tora]
MDMHGWMLKEQSVQWKDHLVLELDSSRWRICLLHDNKYANFSF